MIKSDKMVDRRYIAEEINKHADGPGLWRYSENVFELARGYLELEEKNQDLRLQVRRLEETYRLAMTRLSEAVELADLPEETIP